MRQFRDLRSLRADWMQSLTWCLFWSTLFVWWALLRALCQSKAGSIPLVLFFHHHQPTTSRPTSNLKLSYYTLSTNSTTMTGRGKGGKGLGKGGAKRHRKILRDNIQFVSGSTIKHGKLTDLWFSEVSLNLPSVVSLDVEVSSVSVDWSTSKESFGMASLWFCPAY